MSAASPLVSVVIPVRDDAERLSRCLAALSRQSLQDPFEVIVVDNGSTDDPSRAVDGVPNIRLLSEAKPTSYAARNTGARAADGSILAFTDSDCVPAPDWLEQGVRTLHSAGPDAFVGGRVDVFPSDPSRPTAAELHELVHAFPQRSYVETKSFSVTANLFVHQDAFWRTGPFSEDLVSSGDLEWGNRARRSGVRPVYAGNVIVKHPARRSLRQIRLKVRRLHTGARQLRTKHDPTANVIEADASRLRPPVRAIARNWSRLERPSVRNRALYTSAALYVHYLDALGSRRRGGDVQR